MQMQHWSKIYFLELVQHLDVQVFIGSNR